MMKAPFLLLLIAPLCLLAQQYPVNSININLPQNPDAFTANWTGGNSLLSINVTTRALAGKLDPILEGSKILVQIKKGGAVICGSYTPSSAPAAGFSGIVKIWSGNAAVSLLGQECKLPPGEYQICVRFYGGLNNSPLSEEKCKAFTVKNTEQAFNKPLNIIPVNESIFNLQMASAPVLFKWTAVSPNPGTVVKYLLKVWKKTTGVPAAQIINSTEPVFTKEYNGLTQTSVPNLIDPSCLTGGCEFVWQVQALGNNGISYGANNGISDYTVFKTNASNVNTNNNNTGACASTSTKTYAIGDEISLSNDFKMKFSTVPTGTNDSLTGEGIVRVQWLGIFNVRFKGIKINAQDKLCAGSIHTKTDPNQNYPIQFLINATSVNNYGGAWTINKLSEVTDKIKANKHLKAFVPAEYAPLVDSSLAVQPINMPIGYFKSGDTSEAFGFTEMIFRPDFAEFEAIASLNTEKIFKNPSNTMNGTGSIGLRGYGIQFSNTGITGISGSLKLIDEVVVSYANTGTENLKMIFNKESNGHIGNGIVFSANDPTFWKYNLDVDVQLPREFLIPVDTSKTNVAFNFQLNISKWSDYVIEGTLPACIIPNTNGLGIKAGIIAYDHSYVANPTGMVFPDGYAGNTNNFFSGFYLKNFSMTLPDELRSYADTSKRIEVFAQNLIIDEYGLSGKIWANNIISFPKANIGNLGASIDTVSVTFANGSLTEGRMKGKITLPLSSSSSVANALNYSALFASNNSSFVFMLKPGADISSTFLGEGKLKINQTSSLNLSLSKVNNKRAVSFSIDINGNLYYPSGKMIDPGSNIPLDLDLSCNFQHLGMTYSTGSSDNFTFNPGQWSFASPQKKFSGFAFTITDVKPKIDPVETIAEKQYLFKGGVELVAKINIGSENSNIAISGDTKLILRGAILSSKYVAPANSGNNGMNILTAQVIPPSNMSMPGSLNAATSMVKEQYGFLTELKPKYLGIEVKSIHVDVSTAAVKIKGSVEFFKKDIKYGNGFKGELQAKFTTMNMAIQAGAVFGNTKYIPGNSGNGFKYWMVEAQANLPAPGIPFLSGVAFRGFGAGVYSRMKMTLPAQFNPTTASESTFGGAVFTPDATVKFGFKAKVILATTPKEETFNGSAALSAEFNTSGGMNFIRFDGLFYCGAKIIEPEKSFANGSLLVEYDFPQKIFNMNASLNINKDPISTITPANMRLYIDGKNNKWYFKSGTPTNPMWVRISSADIQAYLMFGNDLGTDIPSGFMQKTSNGFANLGFTLPQFSETATSDNKYQSAKGFAFGLGVYNTTTAKFNIVDFHGSLCDCRRFVDIDYAIQAGGEINASLLQYEGCTGFGKGWRARMSIAVYAGASISYSYSLPAFGSSSGWLASAKAAAYAIAEFPNPTYIAGKVEGAAKTIGGYNATINRSFSIGNQCAGTEQSGGANTVYQQENVVDSLDYSLIKLIVTPGVENISRTTNFAVLFNYPFNQSFSIDEQQANGNIKTRTFKATYTTSLVQDTTGIPTPPIPLYAKGADMYGARKFQLSNTPIVSNPLKPNTSYRFSVNAKLEEQVNNVWVSVKKKGTTIAVTQQEQLSFKTNGESVSTTITNLSNSNSVAPKKLIIQ